MPVPTIAEPILFSEIFAIPKAEMQVLVRVKPHARVTYIPQFEVYDSQFIGGSRNRNRERKLSPGMIRFLSAVMKVGEHAVKVKWIMAEWDSVVLTGSETAIRKLLTHEQVESYQNHLRMRSFSFTA